MSTIGQITKISDADRRATFKEVSCGFSEEEAQKEAKRCLQCPTSPCTKGCPAAVAIKTFIKEITQKDYPAALATIRKTNSLPAVCGRVCPQEEQCQLHCVLNKKNAPIQIGYLERFVADQERVTAKRASESLHRADDAQKVAVIGSGPAGLSCAADLVRKGYKVTVFEALHKVGGVLTYGIPEFRLPKDIVAYEAAHIKSLGAEVVTDAVVGRTVDFDDLRAQGYKAFFVGAGAGLPQFMGIPGENINGVCSANEFLTRINLMRAYDFPKSHTPIELGRKIVVFGAGNVAFDCARSALRLGAEKVSMLYRRTKTEMPARHEEIHNAEEEGIEFELLVTPKEILADAQGRVRGVRCTRNELGMPDAGGRRRPIEIAGSDFEIEADLAVVAIGTVANPLLISAMPQIELTSKGFIKTDEALRSSEEDIFAGGDIVSGAATVILAIQQGKKAAVGIDAYLQSIA